MRERASASLQHIFTLLSAALPEQALLRLAFNGLHTDDSQRRGTALEYLDQRAAFGDQGGGAGLSSRTVVARPGRRARERRSSRS